MDGTLYYNAILIFFKMLTIKNPICERIHPFSAFVFLLYMWAGRGIQLRGSSLMPAGGVGTNPQRGPPCTFIELKNKVGFDGFF